jgi:hypothetical protein
MKLKSTASLIQRCYFECLKAARAFIGAGIFRAFRGAGQSPYWCNSETVLKSKGLSRSHHATRTLAGATISKLLVISEYCGGKLSHYKNRAAGVVLQEVDPVVSKPSDDNVRVK